MNRLLWLASYPRSGNTWLRVFVANLLRDAEEPADVNELRVSSSAADRTLFDDLAGVESSDLTADEIERLRPAAYERLAAAATQVELVKIHDANTRTGDGRPLTPARATLGVIYLLRNPLDVAVSYARYGRSDPDAAIAWMADEGHCLAAAPGCLHPQLRQRLLTWSGHVRSWVDAPGLAVHVLRYEDMSRDGENAFGAAMRFAGLPSDPSRVRRCSAADSPLAWPRFS